MNELYHYNKNHDRLGRFASGRGGGSRKSTNPKDVRSMDIQKVKMQYANRSKVKETQVLESVVDELMASPEGKDYGDLQMFKAKAESSGSLALISKDLEDEVVNAYYKKGVELTKQRLPEIAGAVLEDLGYEDTKEGRDYLIKKGIVHL